MNLNLEAKNKQEEIIKKYLEDNVGEILADKINNGVKITKDNKTLINKKTLSGFMQYACNEARKQAEKVQIVLVLKMRLSLAGLSIILKKTA